MFPALFRQSYQLTATLPVVSSTDNFGNICVLVVASSLTFSRLDQLIHCTTIASNIVIERKGARVGLIATEGFRDVLDLGVDRRYDMYDLFLKRPAGLVPRHLRCTVSERLDFAGAVLKRIDPASIDRAAEYLRSQGVEAIAVALLHSYRNPDHEWRVRDALLDLHPDAYVSISSDVAPEIREYERTLTTVVNAFVQPAVDAYLKDMERLIRELGSTCTIYLMASGGGLISVDVGRKLPVRLIESGPSAGAVAAAEYGRRHAINNLVSFDMGGTTAKICLVRNGEPTRSDQMEIAREARFKKGSGLLLRVPAIEMIEIGAGGGSIAHVDAMGLVRVGPESAGAHPGPACYGRGGAKPTVTDANLVLGFLDPAYFLGGGMRLDRTAAQTAIERDVARPLGIGVADAAMGVYDIVTENMATATRVYAAEQGEDLRKSTLIAFGGAGPVHAYRIAEVLGIPRVVCPLGAGVFSSIGLQLSGKSFDLARSYMTRVDHLDWEYLRQMMEAMRREAVDTLVSAGVDQAQVRVSYAADMRYVGQAFEVIVPLAEHDVLSGSADRLVARFEHTYRQTFVRAVRDLPVEVQNWRINASGPDPKVELHVGNSRIEGSRDPIKGRRRMYVRETGGYAEVPVFDRYGLREGASVPGPALVEERESTVVVGARARAMINETLDLVMELG